MRSLRPPRRDPAILMQQRTLRVALVGTGRIAHDWQAAIAALPERFALVGGVDPQPEALEWLKGLAVPGFASVRDLCNKSAPDLAIVCSPPATHENAAEELLAGGCHVLCEKPVSVSEASAARMYQAAERHRRTLSMASKFRFVHSVRRAAALVTEGTIGQPLLYEGAFTGFVDMANRWNSNPSLSGGGVLMDNGSHAADLARFLLGSPIVRVLAHFGRRTQPIGVEDTVRVLFEVAGGCIGTFDLSWAVPKGDPHFVKIWGEAGEVEIGWQETRWRSRDEPKWHRLGGEYDKLAAFREQLVALHEAIQHNEPPPVAPPEALESLRVIESGYRSAMAARWVPTGNGQNSNQSGVS